MRYINFYYEEAKSNREKGLGWILLALNKIDDFSAVLKEVFANIPILQLYSKEDSYVWQNRKELLECLESVKSKNMYNPCPLLDNFMEFTHQRERN